MLSKAIRNQKDVWEMELLLEIGLWQQKREKTINDKTWKIIVRWKNPKQEQKWRHLKQTIMHTNMYVSYTQCYCPQKLEHNPKSNLSAIDHP